VQDKAIAAQQDIVAVQADARLHVASLEQQLRQVESELAACRTTMRKKEACCTTQSGTMQRSSQLSRTHGTLKVDRCTNRHAAETTSSKHAFMSFLQALAAGRTTERDALLPVVGMHMGASPAECLEMKRLISSGSALQFW
jgi:TolA-binding protein